MLVATGTRQGCVPPWFKGHGGRHAVGACAKQDQWAVVKARHVQLEEPRIGSRCGARGRLALDVAMMGSWPMTGSRCGARGQLLRFGAQARQTAPLWSSAMRTSSRLFGSSERVLRVAEQSFQAAESQIQARVAVQGGLRHRLREFREGVLAAFQELRDRTALALGFARCRDGLLDSYCVVDAEAQIVDTVGDSAVECVGTSRENPVSDVHDASKRPQLPA